MFLRSAGSRTRTPLLASPTPSSRRVLANLLPHRENGSFPMIGKKVSNGWKICVIFSNGWKIFFQWLDNFGLFFQRLEKFFGGFPMIGKNFRGRKSVRQLRQFLTILKERQLGQLGTTFYKVRRLNGRREGNGWGSGWLDDGTAVSK